MIRPTSRIALALALLIALGACGKEGRPSAPEGAEANYTYPNIYPNPSSVVPIEEEDARKTGEAPTHAGGLKVFPTDTRSKTTYDSGPIQ